MRNGWICLALVLVVAAGCTRQLNISGHAMEPTLMDGEKVPASRAVGTLARGDIVGFRYPQDESKSFVKRIIGLPGEQIRSANGKILINDKPLDEPYVVETNRLADSWGPITIPEGKYFMMGDNRGNSSDSRSWGLVGRDAIWAKIIR
jgi:signal peptidase I